MPSVNGHLLIRMRSVGLGEARKPAPLQASPSLVVTTQAGGWFRVVCSRFVCEDASKRCKR